MYCVKLFENHSDIKKIYNNNFKYILVDEFQDTNFIQNKWLNLLVNEQQNICCVGDDDQSIYSWRGAEIKNFLTFDQIYKNCKVFKLEQNYRSTKNILETASTLISNNSNRVGKKLWSSANQGELVKLNCYRTGKEEAQGISDVIEHKLKKIIHLMMFQFWLELFIKQENLKKDFYKLVLVIVCWEALNFMNELKLKMLYVT